MSGGVDSSVAAAMLREQGLEVVGCFMRLGTDDSAQDADDACRVDPAAIKPGHQGCCSLNDASDARLVAALLDVPFYVLNFRRDFGRVIDYFVSEYNAGRTPNPCVRCNDWLKFGRLANYARSIDAKYIASGHYARIVRHDGCSQLHRGLDPGKDQSYVLFGLPPADLSSLLLPIGGLTKPVVREMAQRWKLPVFDKPDSQEICFVPDNNYAGLIQRQTPGAMQQGDILDQAGHVVGQHPGQQHFTIGQRRGVGVALGHPIYVIEKDAQANTITVGDKAGLMSRHLQADQVNWLIPADEQPQDWRPVTVKVRYNSPPVPGFVRCTGQDRIAVRFDQPVLAVTPGQAVVCYEGSRVLGGGWISHVSREPEADPA